MRLDLKGLPEGVIFIDMYDDMPALYNQVDHAMRVAHVLDSHPICLTIIQELRSQ